MAGTRKFNEADVLDQAIHIFWSKGYTATTMLDLAKETGVQRGSLYHAYKNKNTLFIKAFEHYITHFLQFAESSLQQKDVATAFDELFHQLITRLADDKGKRGCFSTRTIMEAANQCPEISQLLKDLLGGLEKLFAQRLEQAQKEGQFSGEVQASARYLVAITRGIAVVERVYEDQEYLHDIYKTALDNMPFIGA